MRYEVENGRRITESALVDRINKKLAHESQDLKESQMAGSPSVGNFYGQDGELGAGKEPIDLEAIGRELGVLASDETIAHCSDPLSPSELAQNDR